MAATFQEGDGKEVGAAGDIGADVVGHSGSLPDGPASRKAGYTPLTRPTKLESMPTRNHWWHPCSSMACCRQESIGKCLLLIMVFVRGDYGAPVAIKTMDNSASAVFLVLTVDS